MTGELVKRLEAKQINPTAMRLLVLEFLARQRAAITLIDLENGLDHSDRVTIYRTLKTFEEKGMVHRIDDGTGAAKYALCPEECGTQHHHDLHIHFYCTTCKETTCLPSVGIPDVRLPESFRLSEISLVAKGTCDKCAR